MGTLSDEVQKAFAANGALARHLPGFQPRPQQQEMAQLIAKVLETGGIAVIEAGTGVGKSFGYVVPVLLKLAQETRQESSEQPRAVIATNKKPLQDQLARDIPKLCQALGISATAVVLKGRNNYLSRRRLHNALGSEEISLFDPGGMRRQALELVAKWAKQSKSGELADLVRRLDSNGSVNRELRAAVMEVWPRVRSDSHDCMRQACPHFTQCFFFGAKKAAEQAQLIITNQSLLAMEMLLRRQLPEEADISVLPSYSYLVIDEAHTLAESFTAASSAEVSVSSLKRLVERLAPANSQRRWRGLIAELEAALSDYSLAPIKLVEELRGPLRDRLAHLAKLWETCFQSLRENVERRLSEEEEKMKHNQIRYPGKGQPLKHAEENPDFAEFAELFSESTLEALRECVQQAQSLGRRGKDDVHDLATRSAAVLQGVVECLETLRHFANTRDKQWCRWYDVSDIEKAELTLSIAPIHVSETIRQLLTDECLHSAILTSATLAIGKNNFRPILKDWGLKEEECETLVCDSPFNYKRNCVFAVPSDLSSYMEANPAAFIERVLAVTQGRAFLLFTAWDNIEPVWNSLAKRLKKMGLSPMKQSPNEPAQVVLERFREEKNGVLFGTMSFWEGVDIPGDQLSCVIIIKLPFPVPDTPLLEARAEGRGLYDTYAKFKELELPIMVTKLRQGFGRLIRTESDRGAVVLLDNRLLDRSYKTLVLDSLPPAQQVFAPAEKIVAHLEEFFSQSA